MRRASIEHESHHSSYQETEREEIIWCGHEGRDRGGEIESTAVFNLFREEEKWPCWLKYGGL